MLLLLVAVAAVYDSQPASIFAATACKLWLFAYILQLTHVGQGPDDA